MAFVEIILMVQGVLEVVFGFGTILYPENVFAKITMPFSYNTEACVLWCRAIVALGAACLYMALISLRTKDQRYTQGLLALLVFYHCGLLFDFGVVIFNPTKLEDYADPELIQTLIIPDFLLPISSSIADAFGLSFGKTASVQMSPVDGLVGGFCLHFVLFFFTLIAFLVCNTDGPLTKQQYDYFLQYYQRQQQQQQQQRQRQSKPTSPSQEQPNQQTLSAKSHSKKAD